MIDFLSSYASLLDLILFNTLLALSQHVVLRAGVFSLSTAAFTSLGAYAVALSITKTGLSMPLALLLATATGAVLSAVVALPLSRIRGVYQALATLALVQIVLSITLNATSITNGSQGIFLAKAVNTNHLLGVVALVMLFLWGMGSCSIGRAFDVIREDETVAVSLGISVKKHHMIAFVVSGAIAGLAGGLHAGNSYSITPNEFGFQMVVGVLAMVVLGGSTSIWGALAGAIVLSGLPELFRVFADYRMAMQGLLLTVCIIYIPRGLAHSIIAKLKLRKSAKNGLLLRRKSAP